MRSARKDKGSIMHYQRAAALALGAILGLSACSQGAQQAPPPLSVDVASALRRNIATYVQLDGQVQPLEQSTLAFQQNGTITSISVNVGDHVRAGQVLATIDSSVLRAQAAQAAAQANQQSATAQGSQVGLPVQIQTNQATLATALAALRNAKLVYDQDVALEKDGYVSEAQLEAARAAYVQAAQAYNTANVGLANNQVSEQNTKAAVAAAVAAQANARTLNTQVAQTTLYAPYDGVITQRLQDPGSYAGPTAPVLGISRVGKLWININVPDTDLPYVEPGSAVSFTSSSLPGRTFNAKIATVNAVPTAGTLSYLARVQMDNPGEILRGGMLVTATLPRESHNNTIVVPRSAVAQTENGYAVYVVGADNKAQEVPVRVGVQTDTLSEVISPKVQPGTRVITTRPDTLKDGSLVAINSSGNAPPANGGSSTK
jgi:multidrug efflux pump subunit AcrA (membrane-fusion protein)